MRSFFTSEARIDHRLGMLGGRRRASLVLLCTVLVGGFSRPGAAQISQGTAAARAEVDRGVAALKRGEPEVAATAFRTAIGLDPIYFVAHERFVSTTRAQAGTEKQRQIADQLRALYQTWLAAQPRNAVLYYFLGTFETDPDKADADFLKAVELAPKFAQAYERLGFAATVRGDNAQASEWLRKAADATPDSPDDLFRYAWSLADRDPASWTRVALSVVDRFPGTQRASQALYWLGQKAGSTADSVKYFERLRRDYPPDKYSWSESAMASLFDIYSRTDPEKALALASEMADKRIDSYLQWSAVASMQENVLAAQRLIDQRRPAEAVDLLEKTEAPKYVRTTQLTLALADAENAAGQADEAYSQLLDLAAAQPSDIVLRALTAQAGRLKKSEAQVRQDLRGHRDALARPAPPFSLVNPADQSRVSLSAFRGKAVLLAFWSPDCASCRDEFPRLQRVLDMHKTGLVVLAVNVDSEQAGLVAPFVTNNRYGFVPLLGTRAVSASYGVTGVPSLFLIDQRGRIVFTPRAYNPDTQRSLELQVEALLQHGPIS